MKGRIAGLALAWLFAAACSAGSDNIVEGTRAQCAYGGAITDCPDAERTPQGACWRLVDCGAIALDVQDPNDPGAFDWGVCVNGIEALTADRQQLVTACIAASTCDELRIRTQNGDLYCGLFGNR